MRDLDYYAECYERYLDSIGDNSLTLKEELQEMSREVLDLKYALRQTLSRVEQFETHNAIAAYLREVLEEG